MAKKNKLDLRELSLEELNEQIGETKVRLQRLRFNHAISPIENPNVIGELKRDVARFKTEIRARELGLNQAKV